MVLLFLRKFFSGLHIKEKLNKSAEYAAPFVIASTILLTLSYITDINPGEQINHGLVSSAFPRISSSLGKLGAELIFPLICAFTALSIGGTDALAPAILGGALSVSGYSLNSPDGSINAVSGVFGAVNTGLLAGWWIILLRKFISKIPKKFQSGILRFLPEISGVFAVAIFSLGINSLSLKSGEYTSIILALAKGKSDFLVVLLLPFFVNFNPGGATYLAAFTFSAAMLRSGSSFAQTSVFVSTLVPVISMGLYYIIFRKRNNTLISSAGILGLITSFSGVHISPLLLYIANPFRSILSFTVGSTLSSVLCYFFSCEVRAFEGGFLAAPLMNKPITIFMVTLSGAVLSTAILCLTEKKVDGVKHQW